MKTQSFRRRPARRVLGARVGRGAAITATCGRTLLVAAPGVALLAYAATRLHWTLVALAVVFTAAETSSTLGVIRYRPQGDVASRWRPLSATPPSVTAAVADLAPRLGLRADRLTVVVRRVGRRNDHTNNAAAAGWLGGGLVIVDDDLAVKADTTPGGTVDDEVRGVIGHELGHIHGLHALTSAGTVFSLAAAAAIAAGQAAAVTLNRPEVAAGEALTPNLAWFAVVAVIVLVADRWASRQAEYAADRASAVACGTPNHLADALEQDFSGGSRGWKAVFDRHPPTSRRVRRLRGH